MITIKELLMNQISVLNNPQEIDMSLNKLNQTYKHTYMQTYLPVKNLHTTHMHISNS